ncbi:MAG: hypothetical protein E6R13_05850 [Spirochaetes bacterium]|nr:MAG: hypothetical protein E6R13_05850 [Spirochaetota bacterium]
MADYRKIAEEALRKAKLGKQKPTLNESIVYPDGLTERMHPQLEEELAERKHSLGKHPAFPEGDECSFEQKIMGERFNEVASRYKRAFDCDSIDNQKLVSEMMPLVHETMAMEASNKKALEELAVRMIREEYNMGEDVVEIHAELTPKISLVGTKKNPKPVTSEMEFDNHESMINANKEVYKRRFLNAMTQGAAKKCNHMFHMVDDELTNLNPRLASKYAKMMAAADYLYYVIPKMENGTTGGVVKVQFPSAKNPKAVIYAQAMVFPVLIHELVKGVMELLSAHGLPKDRKTGEFVINKADFLAAEPWDMRIGPALWSRFTQAIDPDDFELKHHIYSEMAALPVDEFNMKMREVMAGTKEGKKIIKGIVDEVKAGLQEDEFNEAMNEISSYEDENSVDNSRGSEDVEGFDFEELMGLKGGDDSRDDSRGSEDDEEGFEFGELF